MKAAVLGATGFIGGQIARKAIENGMDVHALRRDPSSVGAVGDLPLTWHSGDLDDADSLIAAMQGCEVLFHAAAYAPATDRRINHALCYSIPQMRRVLSAARHAGIKKVIYTSSLTTIGPSPANEGRLADERDPYTPGTVNSSYYESKWQMEYEALRAAQSGLEVVTLCPTAVFGPGDVKPSTSQLLLLIAKQQIPVGVDIDVNIVDGRDVAQAHINAVTRGQSGERYIIAGHNLNVADAIRQSAQIMGVKAPRSAWGVKRVKRLLAIVDFLRLPVTETMRTMPHWQPLNGEKGWRELEFSPRPFAETVRDTHQWFLEHGYLD